MSLLLCPVCHKPLDDGDKKASCENGHRFDRAREGYLNLLRSSKAGDTMGDPKARRARGATSSTRGTTPLCEMPS